MKNNRKIEVGQVRQVNLATESSMEICTASKVCMKMVM